MMRSVFFCLYLCSECSQRNGLFSHFNKKIIWMYTKRLKTSKIG